MGLTGVAPVLGALSMWDLENTSLFKLFILFGIGCFSHIYGFVLNDVMDVKIDKLSNELLTRPLVSGVITKNKATYFAIFCMIFSFIFTAFFYKEPVSYFLLITILLIAYLLATIYNIISKKYPGMDFFVASAIFFLIIFGASTVGMPTPLAYVVALIGSIQVLFMNMINGAIKDIDHDEKGLANILAIKLGAKTKGKAITLPNSFKLVGYLIEIIRSFLIFAPFLFFSFAYELWQIALLIILTILIFVAIFKMFLIKEFVRNRIRKNIAIIVIFMYATTPIMLSSLNLYIVLLAIVPPLWFICSNLILHHTIFVPKTM